MLKRLSKTGFFLQFIIFLAIGVMFWFPAFVQPVASQEMELVGPLYHLFSSWLNGNLLISVSLAALLVFGLAFLNHIMLASNDLIPRDGFVDAIILLILLSWNPGTDYFHAALPAGILLLLAVNMLMRMYGQTDPYQYVLSASFSIGMAALFYLPAIYFMIGLWLSLLTYRIASWREWLISLIGVILPVIYILSFYFLTGKLSQGIKVFIAALHMQFITGIYYSTVALIFLISSVLMLMITFVATLNSIQDKVISIRRKAWIMIDFSIAGLIMLLLGTGSLMSGYILMMIPLTFFLTYAAVSAKKNRLSDWLVFAFVMLVIVLHYLI